MLAIRLAKQFDLRYSIFRESQHFGTSPHSSWKLDMAAFTAFFATTLDAVL